MKYAMERVNNTPWSSSFNTQLQHQAAALLKIMNKLPNHGVYSCIWIQGGDTNTYTQTHTSGRSLSYRFGSCRHLAVDTAMLRTLAHVYTTETRIDTRKPGCG